MNTYRDYARRTGIVKARCQILAVCILGLTGCAIPDSVNADPGPALTVDAAAGRHAISPEIYGLNDNPWDAALGKEIGVPVSRWGGDATTCYNWQTDASNSGGDWFFMAGGGKPGPVVPSGSADAFVAKVKSVSGKALLTIPVIDYVNSIKLSDWDCSFPVSLLGPQKDHNPYVHPVVNGQQTDAGSGHKPDGTNIVLTPDQIKRVYIPNTPAYEQTWLQHLIQHFGKASGGGVAVYEMDNEPGGWANTHRDIHPGDPTYQEIVAKTLPYARMVKETDPTALVDGPGDFGWAVYQGDPAKNGGLWNAEYYLQQFQAASQKSGHRLLDYFDEHYYPIAQDGQDDAIRLESTRSLWDPTYVEKDWIGQYGGAINLIPRMHEWVNKYYPGTKLAITEYNWNLGGTQTVVDGLVEADILGSLGVKVLTWQPCGDRPDRISPPPMRSVSIAIMMVTAENTAAFGCSPPVPTRGSSPCMVPCAKAMAH